MEVDPTFIQPEAMETLNGEVDAHINERKKTQKDELERIKATPSNKEAFDAKKFFEFRGKTPQYGTKPVEPTDDELFMLEYRYYIDYPEIASMEAYAEKLEELDSQDAG